MLSGGSGPAVNAPDTPRRHLSVLPCRPWQPGRELDRQQPHPQMPRPAVGGGMSGHVDRPGPCSREVVASPDSRSAKRPTRAGRHRGRCRQQAAASRSLDRPSALQRRHLTCHRLLGAIATQSWCPKFMSWCCHRLSRAYSGETTVRQRPETELGSVHRAWQTTFAVHNSL